MLTDRQRHLLGIIADPTNRVHQLTEVDRTAVAAALVEIDGPATASPSRPPISPMDCKHHGALLVESSSGGPPHRSHAVTVCPRCGRFAVSGDNEGHRFRVEFELPTARLVRAAGRYCHYLSLEDVTRYPREDKP